VRFPWTLIKALSADQLWVGRPALGYIGLRRFHRHRPAGSPPGGYISGDWLSGEATFAGADFEDLGLTPGTYVWSWGAGLHADTFTVQIGVPEPSTWAILMVGFGGVGLVGYRRTRKATAIG
jgi:PEP-CTERM motif